MEVISGKEMASELKSKIANDADGYIEKYGRRPNLVVVIVGEDPGSVSYVKGKSKACDEAGIDNHTIVLDGETTESELLDQIVALNNDSSVDGILIQLPLPKGINEARVIETISADKDVDGFHPMNVAGLWQNRQCVLPCTPKGIIKMLKSCNIEISGKKAVVIGRSNIVGLPVAKLLMDENATVTICHSRTKNLAEVCAGADILVPALGRAKFVKPEMVKEGAVVIDVGVNYDEETGKLCGDVDFQAVAPKCSYISKVPGGVGPMTIACLIENTVECFLRGQKR